ncbi:MAG: Rpn family recombination-promoting nuclease/putative transposase [Candidatus Competibacteraceae bacterium]|nr:Rpn family recombination-promoting nuclease/putative transposase [Candidatus Competibacteraceae bacterium]
MKHPIDPKIDCVFKALLGAERNRRLSIHFLNAILAGELPAPITAVEILNPYNEREFLDDKLSIVDVKARDQAGRLYQIEIQLLNLPDLPARILYGWADLYSAQLRDGDGYGQLQPTYAIWLLGKTLRPRIAEAVHRFRWRDDQGRNLVEHGGIWLLELSKCTIADVETEQERWLKFFTEGHRLDPDHLPEWMHTAEMRQAMDTLKAFSDKERAYHQYQARQNYLRQQQSIEDHLNALRAEAEQARAEIEQARLEKEQAQAEKEQAQAEKEQAQAEKETARAAEEQARAAEEQARAAEERERAEKEAALAEIERLKILLGN